MDPFFPLLKEEVLVHHHERFLAQRMRDVQRHDRFPPPRRQLQNASHVHWVSRTLQKDANGFDLIFSKGPNEAQSLLHVVPFGHLSYGWFSERA